MVVLPYLHLHFLQFQLPVVNPQFKYIKWEIPEINSSSFKCHSVMLCPAQDVWHPSVQCSHTTCPLAT